MSAEVIEIEPQAVDLDPIFSKLRETHDKVARAANKWLAVKARYLRFVQEMVLLGCDLTIDSDFDPRFTATGDKQKFLELLRCHRRHGFKPIVPEKGATTAFWRITPYDDEACMWFQFSSTVCHRVKVGTKMVEQDVYETHCESIAPDVPAELPAPVAVLPSFADDIPF